MSDSIPVSPVPGLTGEVTLRVSEAHTAAALGSGNVNAFSTPALIALLEGAAVTALQGQLPDGYTSVGTHLDVRHLAATPVGMTVRATARLIEVDGRRLLFAVEAYDEVELIGAGTHERFVVNKAHFEARVAAKGG
jgi:predicted thioesterase